MIWRTGRESKRTEMRTLIDACVRRDYNHEHAYTITDIFVLAYASICLKKKIYVSR